MKRKVISRGNLPHKLPVFNTLVIILAMDYWNAPQWLCGVIGVIVALLWIACGFCLATEEGVDIMVKTKGKDLSRMGKVGMMLNELEKE